MTNIDNLGSKKTKLNRKSCKGILIYYIRYKTSNGVKPLYIIFSKTNGYIEDNDGNKYPTLIPIDEKKDMLKNLIKLIAIY